MAIADKILGVIVAVIMIYAIIQLIKAAKSKWD